jgi:phage terminase large subunit
MSKADNILYEATERQMLFHASSAQYKLYGGAMGGGKTFALCAEGIALSIDYPGNRGYLCRHTLTSFKKTTFIVLDEMLQRSGLIVKHHQSDHIYSLRNGSTIFYGGLGDDTNAIERLKSMELGWFGIDEASETSEKFFLMLSSRLRLKLSGIKYFGIMATNPDPGWLKQRFIDRKDPNHIFIPALPKDNPYLPKDYVDRLREVFPDDWQARFIEGDWSAFEGASNVFPYQAIQAAVERDLPEGKPVELGVDVARYGDDESVIAVRKGPVGRIKKTFKKNDLMQLTGETIQAKTEDHAEALKVDADGMGGGVVDRLREQGHVVVEIHGGGKATDSEKFRNMKAEIHWAFRDRLLSGDIDLPDDLELKAQLTSITYRVASSGQLEITPKEEMKRKGLKSPDRAEAMIYSFAADPNPGAYFGFTKHEVY